MKTALAILQDLVETLSMLDAQNRRVVVETDVIPALAKLKCLAETGDAPMLVLNAMPSMESAARLIGSSSTTWPVHVERLLRSLKLFRILANVRGMGGGVFTGKNRHGVNQQLANNDPHGLAGAH